MYQYLIQKPIVIRYLYLDGIQRTAIRLSQRKGIAENATLTMMSMTHH